MTNKDISWKEWNPGLDNGTHTLQNIINTLPGNDPDAIHLLIRLFENPESPIAFKGAITLERHDCVHIMLGRGLLPQDEAFVIGFTMGTSKNITSLESFFFQMITKYLYPPPYNFSNDDLMVFKLGLERGKECKVREIYNFPFEDHLNDTINSLRERLSLNITNLQKVYRKEQDLLPNSTASKRLPIDTC